MLTSFWSASLLKLYTRLTNDEPKGCFKQCNLLDQLPFFTFITKCLRFCFSLVFSPDHHSCEVKGVLGSHFPQSQCNNVIELICSTALPSLFVLWCSLPQSLTQKNLRGTLLYKYCTTSWIARVLGEGDFPQIYSSPHPHPHASILIGTSVQVDMQCCI